LFENIREVIVFGDYRMVLATWNSILLTVFSVILLIILSTPVAYVMQRRLDRMASIASTIMLAGLIIPPAVVPTFFLLQWLGIYKTLFGLIMIEVAIQMPFAILVFRAFMASIPRELDEAAIIDGATPL
jgi:raffinose/stachyose/melibiose transport system permease protein